MNAVQGPERLFIHPTQYMPPDSALSHNRGLVVPVMRARSVPLLEQGVRVTDFGRFREANACVQFSR